LSIIIASGCHLSYAASGDRGCIQQIGTRNTAVSGSIAAVADRRQP